ADASPRVALLQYHRPQRPPDLRIEGLRQVPRRQTGAGGPAPEHDPHRHRGRHVESRAAHDKADAVADPRRNAGAAQLPVDAPVRLPEGQHRARPAGVPVTPVRRLPRRRDAWGTAIAGTGEELFGSVDHLGDLGTWSADAVSD